jgi:hypothetical protein
MENGEPALTAPTGRNSNVRVMDVVWTGDEWKVRRQRGKGD